MAFHQDILIFDESEPGLNRFIWTDGAGNEHTDLRTLPSANSGLFVMADSEQGHRRPIQVDYIEPTPDRLSDQYRSPVYQPRLYSIGVYVSGDNDLLEMQRLIGLWDSWHNAELGQGVFKRVTSAGLIRLLDAVPRPAGNETPIGNAEKTFRQSYIAANPWWRNETPNEVAANYDGTNVVTLSYTNSGEIGAWPFIVITGRVRNPKIRTGSDEIEVLFNAPNADDEIRIDSRPNSLTRRSAFYFENGTGSAVAVPLSSLSRYVLLPRGTSSIRLSAASGDARCVISAFDYYGSLYTEVGI